MAENWENLEPVARHLDGLGESLPPEQQALAEEIRADQQWVGQHLDVAMPHEAMLRIGSQVNLALLTASAQRAHRAGPRRGLRWAIYSGAAGAAIAAGLLIATMINLPLTPTTSNPNGARPSLTPREVVAAWITPNETDMDVELAMLSDQVSTLASELAQPEEPALDVEMDSVSHDITNFWMEPSSETLDADSES